MAASHQCKTVFICHAGESKPFVRQLVDRLKTDGLKEDQIFFDERSLEPGDELDSIVKVIESPSLKLFVFVVSKYCFDNDRTWIRTEWEAALVNNIQILPIWLDDNNDDFKEFGNLVRKFSNKLRKMIAQRVNPQEISTTLSGLSEKIFSLVSGDQPTQRRSPPTTDVVLSSVRPTFMPDVLPAKLKLEFVQKVFNQLLEKSEKLFDDNTLDDEERLQKADKIFNRYKARKESIIPRGCFIFNLRFFQPCNVDEFYHDHFRLGPDSLSAALTRLLITDQMRAAAGGEELMVRVEVRYDDYIRVRRQLCTKGIVKSTSVNNLSTLVPTRIKKSRVHSDLEGLDLAITSTQNSSFTEWVAYPGTRHLARCVKRKSTQVAALTRGIEIQANIVRSLHSQVSHLNKKDEEAQKVLMTKTEDVRRLQESIKSMEATIEELEAAKAKVVIFSPEEDIAPKSAEGKEQEELDIPLIGAGGGASEEPQTSLKRTRGAASGEMVTQLREVEGGASGELKSPLKRTRGAASGELGTPLSANPPVTVTVPDNTRDRLWPWLYGMIDRGEVPGVEWLDADKKKFKIPWKHAGKHEYDQDRDSKLFKEWAIHTGKFRPGIDKPEPAVWKTRLRVALSNHPKIYEVKNESQPEDPINPYKVYVFSDKPPAMPIREAWLGNSPPHVETFIEPQTFTTASLGDTATSSVREDSLQKILQDMLSQPGRGDELLQGMQAVSGPGPTIQEIPMDVTSAAGNPAIITEPLYTNAPVEIETHGKQLVNVDMTQLGVGAEVTCDEDMETDDVMTNPVATVAPTAVVAPELRIYPAHELDIEVVYYKAGIVHKHHVTNRTGCRLWFSDRNQPNLRQTVEPNLSPYLYGPADAEQILLPPRQPSNRQKDDMVVQGLLDNMERGLVLTTENGNISATRLCKTKVFWKSNDNRNRQAERLERGQVVLVFDYQNYLRDLSAYGNSGGPKPKCEVIFSFGKGWSDDVPLENTPIYAIVRSRTAHNLMMAVDKGEELGSGRQDPLRSIDEMMSDDNEFDKLDVDVREYVKVKDF